MMAQVLAGREGGFMKRFLVHWLVIAIALWVTTYIVPGVHVSSYGALAVAAIVLGLVNALVRPVLTILTLPITILTLGLFYLLVNGFTFMLAAFLVPGFQVGGFWWSVVGALVFSVISFFIGMLLPGE
jgi:putative membrane protein